MNLGLLLGVPVMLNIAGTPVPLKDIPQLADAAVKIIHAGQTGENPQRLFIEISPDLMAIAATVANAFYPGSGTAAELIAYIVTHSRPMTPDEEKVWFDRASLHE